MAGGGGDDGGVLVEAVVVQLFDLASLAAAAGLTVAELTAEVDPNSADLEELCRPFGVGLPAKIKIKVELRAARKVQGETREAELAAERAALEQQAEQQAAAAQAQAQTNIEPQADVGPGSEAVSAELNELTVANQVRARIHT